MSGVDDTVDHGSHDETEGEEGSEGTCHCGNEEAPESPGEDHEGSEDGGEEDDFVERCHVSVIPFVG